ncbi:hypothetical protein ACFPA8_08885 [Streptomyces ovatisporus]|uniref:Integral membrane protein n=1 Tax=Streptomyces ovatisporus TaxID=1128682 RepID=A0ABV9A6R4_9ACTN
MSSSTSTVKRSRTRRAGESAFGMLLLVRNIVLVLVCLLVLAAGGWTSWKTAGPALTGDQRGTVEVARCVDDECSGTFRPASGGGSGVRRVTIAESVSGVVGERLQVALKPDSGEAVRTGPAGALYGAVPFGGALLLAALVVAVGLRWRGTALVLGLLGAALTMTSWALLTF